MALLKNQMWKDRQGAITSGTDVIFSDDNMTGLFWMLVIHNLALGKDL